MCAENPINTVSAHRAIATVISGYDSLTLGRVVVENLGISGNQVFADSPPRRLRVKLGRNMTDRVALNFGPGRG